MNDARKPRTLKLPAKPPAGDTEGSTAPETGQVRRKNLVGDRTKRAGGDRRSKAATRPVSPVNSAPPQDALARTPEASGARATSAARKPFDRTAPRGPRRPPAEAAEGIARSGRSSAGKETRRIQGSDAARKPAPKPGARVLEARGAVRQDTAGMRDRSGRPTQPRTAGDGPRTAPPSPRKVPDDGRVRISKLLSERGLCSRREADEFIGRGWVLVDGQPVTELGTRIHPDQALTLARDARAAQLRTVTFLLNKPIGFVSGQPEPGKKPAASLLVPDNRWNEDRRGQRFEPAHLRGLAPAGRLDIDSTGLIVFTQDGRVARRLIGDDSNIEKEYLVRVEGQIQENGLRLLNHGLSLDGQKLKPAKVSWQNEEQLRFVLREGRKRQIRRMCELVGLKVTGLKRIRIGSVVLGKLPPGQWRYLRDDEQF